MHDFALPVVVKLLAYFKPTVADGASMRCKLPIGWKQFALLAWVWVYWLIVKPQLTGVLSLLVQSNLTLAPASHFLLPMLPKQVATITIKNHSAQKCDSINSTRVMLYPSMDTVEKASYQANLWCSYAPP